MSQLQPAHVTRSPLFPLSVSQLWQFGYRQALSCVFPVAVFGTLALTQIIDIPYIHRYDLILIVMLLVQWFMYRTGLESRDEVKVIFIFHLIGLGLELYKVHMGSWGYPEEGWSKIGGVPIYSGFMYASVASYLCQAWRRLDVDLTNWPAMTLTFPLSIAIYLNFFTHHYIPDFRWVLLILVLVIFYRTHVSFQASRIRYRMPLVLAFALIGFFIWIAENISTFLGAWQYPDQQTQWHLVGFGKISSWFLLVIISFIIVAQLKHVKQQRIQE